MTSIQRGPRNGHQRICSCHLSITCYHQLVGWLILTKATKHLLMSMPRQGKYIRYVEGQRLGLPLSGRALVRDSA